jgi:hypothetical protein
MTNLLGSIEIKSPHYYYIVHPYHYKHLSTEGSFCYVFKNSKLHLLQLKDKLPPTSFRDKLCIFASIWFLLNSLNRCGSTHQYT